jgi:hypothetical protein
MNERPAAHLGLALIVALPLTRGLLLAGFVPPFQGTDEPAHADYVQRLAETRHLPDAHFYCAAYSEESRSLDRALGLPIKFRAERPVPPLAAYTPPSPADPAARATSGCGASSTYPPLYYATAAVAWEAVHDAPFLTRLFAARLASVAWGVLTAIFAYFAGLWWFGSRRDALLLGVIVPAQPMVAFLSSVVNKDAAVFACAAAAFAGIAALQRDASLRRTRLLLLALSTLAGVLSNPSFTVHLPAIAGCAVFALGIRRRAAWTSVAAALAPAAIAQFAWSAYTRDAARELVGGATIDISAWEWLSNHVFVLQRQWSVWGRQQYWLSWGWLDTDVASGYYVALAAIVALAALGFAVTWRSLSPRDRALAVAAAGASVAGIVALHGIELQYLRASGMEFLQGRYILPLFPLQAAALVTGLRALGRRAGAMLDGAWAFAALLLVVNVAGLLRGLVRWYGA